MPPASREFQIFVKPVGAICNMECPYCYYLKKQSLYPPGEAFRMPEELLETYIIQHIAASPSQVIGFSWHGGEPALLGLNYFRKIVELQRKHTPPGCRITNGIQTNGLLIDEEWCRFLSSERFGIGLSLDGPQELHDLYRTTKNRQTTHRAAVRAFQLLRRSRVPCDILCVVHHKNVQHPLPVYRFFKEIGATYVSFLPIVEPRPGTDSGVSPETVPAEAYGKFLCAVFDEWLRQDVGSIAVQQFEEAARPICGQEHALCIFRETCGDVPVLEHNGDVFPCDHFVNAEHRLGNIQETPLVDLVESPAQLAFGRAKEKTLPRYCRTCEVRGLCNGGCPKDRFIRTPDGKPGLNYLCAGFKRFFTYSLPYLHLMAALHKDKQPPEKLMQLVQAMNREAFPGTGRNDPCPCGSGRKYKKCCLGKILR